MTSSIPQEGCKWAYESLGNLCRCPRNSEIFMSMNGVSIVLDSLQVDSVIDCLYRSAVFCLGVNATHKVNVSMLIEGRLLEFINYTLNAFLERPSVLQSTAIASLRCLRRLLTSHETLCEAVSRHCIEAILDVIYDFPHHGFSMIVYDALVTLLSMIDASTDTSRDSRLSDGCRMSGVSPIARLGAILTGEPIARKTVIHRYDDVYPLEVPPRLRTPIGTRGCSILGLSDAYIAELIITTRKCLADESTANNLRFQQLGLGCLAYFACEKRGLTSFYSPLKSKLNQIRRRSVGLACEHSMLLSRLKSKRGSLKTSSTASGLRCHSSSIINILHHVIETFGLETAILEEVIILLNHVLLCTTTEDELKAIMDETFFESLLDLSYKNYHFSRLASDTILLYKLMMENSLPGIRYPQFFHLVDLDFPLHLSGFNRDLYPNGVADLPIDIKDVLIKGGRLKVYSATRDPKTNKLLPEKNDFVWKASHDLRWAKEQNSIVLQWRIGQTDVLDGNFPYSVPVATISRISKGFENEAFAVAAKKFLRKLQQQLKLRNPHVMLFEKAHYL